MSYLFEEVRLKYGKQFFILRQNWPEQLLLQFKTLLPYTLHPSQYSVHTLDTSPPVQGFHTPPQSTGDLLHIGTRSPSPVLPGFGTFLQVSGLAWNFPDFQRDFWRFNVWSTNTWDDMVLFSWLIPVQIVTKTGHRAAAAHFCHFICMVKLF